jgi:hypothetical protein
MAGRSPFVATFIDPLPSGATPAYMSYNRAFFAVFAVSGLALMGCSAADNAAGESSSQDLVGDIASMTARGDGSFDVTCKDGVKEIATSSSIAEGKVCARAEPGACSGTPLTNDRALAKIPAGKTEIVLSRFTFAVRAPRDEKGESPPWDSGYRWYDLDDSKTSSDPVSNFRLYVRVHDGSDRSRDRLAQIPLSASLVLKAKEGVAYVQIVTDAGTVPGADTTQLARIVTNEVKATDFGQSSFSYRAQLGTATPGAEPTWRDGSDYESSIETQYSLHFSDGSGTTKTNGIWSYPDRANSIMTERCAQVRYIETTSTLAAAAPSLSVSASFAP